MNAILPKTAPFANDDIEALSGIIARSNTEQRIWLSGFLAGLDARQAAAVPMVAAEPRSRGKLAIVYASETGNAEGLALKARKLAVKQGFDAKVLDMAEADPASLGDARNLIVIAATWGEGDPPERAASFYNQLMADDAPRLDGRRFAVLALGDTAYVNFCATGRAIDARLAELGAERVVDRVDLDLDFAKPAAAWTERALEALRPADAAAPAATVVHVDFKGTGHADELDNAFDAANPLVAEIGEIVNLNGTGSTSETWHIELATRAAGYSYQPGDAIAIAPENDPALAGELAASAGLDGAQEIVDRLVRDFDITTLSRQVIKRYADLTGRADVAALAEADAFQAYAADRQIIDLLAEHRETLTPDQLTGLLRPLPTRLYSVASSLAAHPGETHLLVSAVKWQSHGRQRRGVASNWLAERRPGDTVKLHVRPNRHFRLPQDPNRPIIMIGAGTGVAPYRAFIEERTELGASGGSWLFFGARNYLTDFLYQLEWQDHLESGALSRIDVAFSRDQPEKIYVQQRIAERADALRGWISDGAHIYVCGDEKAMARDVEAALIELLAGDRGEAEHGREQLDELRRAGRYQRDVY
jgi:sulfite reductase (NADPH) flavoprotein alpha-component